MPFYEEIEIEDMTFDEDELKYWYPCPCGDKFMVTLEDLWGGEDVADCQSCTLFIRVVYEESDLRPLPDDVKIEDGDEESDKEKEK
mmetsp:Transcript_15361/g.43278  ORF Transcript_15361/g.43278 Transcript_15361/m.43278 type:complete len:86 (+) Transcript_15361:145-402(+)